MGTINIRSSLLSGYMDCPRRSACSIIPYQIENLGFELRPYVKGVSASIGKAVHKGEAVIMDSKLKTGQTCKEKDTIDAAMTEYEQDVVDAEFDKTTPDKTTGEKQTIRLSTLYHNVVAPEITPKKIWNPNSDDDKLIATIGDGFNVTGHPDVLTVDETVDDTKTGIVYRPCHAQLGSYGLLLRSNNLPVKNTGVHYLKRTTIKKEQPLPEKFSYSLSLCEKAAWNVINVIKKHVQEFLETQNPWSFPVNSMSMLCSEKYCRGYGTKWCELSERE